MKLTKAEKQRKRRLQRQMKASTQNSIFFTSLHENGLMHLAKNDWSRTYRLGDVAYTSANKEDKVEVIDTYAEALNSLDAGNNFQLLVLNKRIETNALEESSTSPKGMQRTFIVKNTIKLLQSDSQLILATLRWKSTSPYPLKPTTLFKLIFNCTRSAVVFVIDLRNSILIWTI